MHAFPSNVPGYQSLGLLGQGASCKVFKARQLSTGQYVTVKIPLSSSPHDPAHIRRVQQRLHQESRLLAMLQHAHVVSILDKGMTGDGSLYLVLEYLPGETLRDYLKHRGSLPLADAIGLMAQLLDALAFMHMHQIVHRDLKPENIMITASGTALHAKIIDLGLASLDGEPAFELGAEGTPAYCAPEQLRGDHCGPATDIYAWALIFVECLNIRSLLQSANFSELLHQKLDASNLAQYSNLATHPLSVLLQKALQENMHQRAASAKNLYAELIRCLSPLQPGYLVPFPDMSTLTGMETRKYPSHLTQDDMGKIGEPAAEFHVLAILAVSLELFPAEKASLALHDLQEIRDQQMNWCIYSVQSDGGHCVGSIGDNLVFHFYQNENHRKTLLHAAMVALDLFRHVTRRSRMLEIQHGIKIEFSGGIHKAILSSGDDSTSFNLGTNTALNLSHLAQPGMILVSHYAHHDLEEEMLLEKYPVAETGDSDAKSGIFRLISEQSG